MRQRYKRVVLKRLPALFPLLSAIGKVDPAKVDIRSPRDYVKQQ